MRRKVYSVMAGVRGGFISDVQASHVASTMSLAWTRMPSGPVPSAQVPPPVWFHPSYLVPDAHCKCCFIVNISRMYSYFLCPA